MKTSKYSRRRFIETTSTGSVAAMASSSLFVSQTTMNYYFIAQIKITDPIEYQKYLDSADRIFSKFKGEYLAVDNNPKILEGTWEYTKSVIIKFNSKNDFNDWYYSADYQNILKFRLTGSKSDTILVAGK